MVCVFSCFIHFVKDVGMFLGEVQLPKEVLERILLAYLGMWVRGAPIPPQLAPVSCSKLHTSYASTNRILTTELV